MKSLIRRGARASRVGWSRDLLVALAGLLVAALTTVPVRAQITPVGGIARNFTLAERGTGRPVQLYDFAGSIVVIDFFAYWCSPCQISSPDLKTNIEDYYRARGGNPAGLPVVVLSANLEREDPVSTDAFIQGFRLDRVVDDYYRVAFDQFTTGPIPLFVVINGVAGLPNRRPWEVLFRASGYPGSAQLRTLIDALAPSNLPGPAQLRAGPVPLVRRIGESARFEVMADGTRPIAYHWSKNDLPLNLNTNRLVLTGLTAADRGVYQVTITNALGSTSSIPVSLVVHDPGITNTLHSTNAPLPVPDRPHPGATSLLVADDDWEIIRLNVNTTLTHPWVGDLAVYLTSPGGTTALVHPATEEAGTRLEIRAAQMPEFIGQRTRGTWILRVVDTTAGDAGTLQSWSLSIEHPPTALRYAQWTAGYAGATLNDPSADEDADGFPNFVEYLMDGFSPVQPNSLPSPEVDPTDDRYLRLILPLRPATERGLLSIQFARTLQSGGGTWGEIPSDGEEVSVDRSDPQRLVIRLRRSLESLFLRLKGVQL